MPQSPPYWPKFTSFAIAAVPSIAVGIIDARATSFVKPPTNLPLIFAFDWHAAQGVASNFSRGRCARSLGGYITRASHPR